MKKTITYLAITITLVISMTYCSSLKLIENSNTATISMSASSKALSGAGSGIVFYIKNVETQEIIMSSSFGLMSNHSVITEVKPGIYRMIGIDLPVGGLVFKSRDKSISEYFGDIILEGGNRYYLGFYQGRQKIGLDRIVSIELKSEEVPDKLRKKFIDSSDSDGSREFIIIKNSNKEPLILY